MGLLLRTAVASAAAMGLLVVLLLATPARGGLRLPTPRPVPSPTPARPTPSVRTPTPTPRRSPTVAPTPSSVRIVYNDAAPTAVNPTLPALAGNYVLVVHDSLKSSSSAATIVSVPASVRLDTPAPHPTLIAAADFVIPSAVLLCRVLAVDIDIVRLIGSDARLPANATLWLFAGAALAGTGAFNETNAKAKIVYTAPSEGSWAASGVFVPDTRPYRLQRLRFYVPGQLLRSDQRHWVAVTVQIDRAFNATDGTLNQVRWLAAPTDATGPEYAVVDRYGSTYRSTPKLATWTNATTAEATILPVDATAVTAPVVTAYHNLAFAAYVSECTNFTAVTGAAILDALPVMPAVPPPPPPPPPPPSALFVSSSADTQPAPSVALNADTPSAEAPTVPVLIVPASAAPPPPLLVIPAVAVSAPATPVPVTPESSSRGPESPSPEAPAALTEIAFFSNPLYVGLFVGAAVALIICVVVSIFVAANRYRSRFSDYEVAMQTQPRTLDPDKGDDDDDDDSRNDPGSAPPAAGNGARYVDDDPDGIVVSSEEDARPVVTAVSLEEEVDDPHDMDIVDMQEGRGLTLPHDAVPTRKRKVFSALLPSTKI